MLDWNNDSAENGWGVGADAVDTTAGGGRGAANKGGGNVECELGVECNEAIDDITLGGGVGLVNVLLVAGDNCVLLVLELLSLLLLFWEEENEKERILLMISHFCVTQYAENSNDCDLLMFLQCTVHTYLGQAAAAEVFG